MCHYWLHLPQHYLQHMAKLWRGGNEIKVYTQETRKPEFSQGYFYAWLRCVLLAILRHCGTERALPDECEACLL
ncbi:MAG: hypothetical protein COA91_03180 [Robiginitomaculum sp.]|nr:MAG: hypothetical protein COA91_03180 [Robiginitomaculum sp.]